MTAVASCVNAAHTFSSLSFRSYSSSTVDGIEHSEGYHKSSKVVKDEHGTKSMFTEKKMKDGEIVYEKKCDNIQCVVNENNHPPEQSHLSIAA